ncbi:GNAT family N-acetyltransferase [Afipia carboxidovorans]|uniref:GNAT family N-acetyltransferase n=1 Tax=Afipia carboxidovorans TaxID=40137 RepID=UPI00308C6359|nr:GNAT family N-acetyltransferase [Afipia carboxidovorans]
MEYRFTIEPGAVTLAELFPLYATHYREMKSRLASDGIEISDFNPRIEEYVKGWNAGHILNYVVRADGGSAVGYSNIYLTNDMHNSELIAQEDTIFLLKEHRNGVGRRFAKFILADLRSRGVKRVLVSAVTDLRVAKVWERMGFKHAAHSMIYTFEGC